MKNRHAESLAYRLWQHRGMPMGSPEEDWFLAEELLRRLALTMRELPLFGIRLDKQTR